jgi:hypothetical protein
MIDPALENGQSLSPNTGGWRGLMLPKDKPQSAQLVTTGCRTSVTVIRKNVSHKNRKISILMIKKNQSKVNTSSTSHREFQRRKVKTENKGRRNRNQKRTKNNIKH